MTHAAWIPSETFPECGGRLALGPWWLVVALCDGRTTARWRHPCGVWWRAAVGIA